MSQEIVTPIELSQLQSEIANKRKQGYRFVTMTCLHTGDGHDILYHFDLKYQLATLKLHLPQGTVLPSISGTIFAALLIENEIKDMFGLQIDGIAIDFGGRLLITDSIPKAPLNKQCGMKVDVRDNKPQGDKASV